MKKGLLTFVAVLLLVFAVSAIASADTIDFEAFNDSDSVTNQIPGLTFSGATAITAGVSLVESEAPPHSGFNVIFNDSGQLEIDFATPVTSVQAFLTYVEPISFEIFDSSNTSRGTSTSLFLMNNVSSGNAPNELFSLSYAGGISRAVFTGANPGDFVLDDLTFSATTPSVPEPASLLLLGAGAFVIKLKLRR